jgi:hypothetical protein
MVWDQFIKVGKDRELIIYCAFHISITKYSNYELVRYLFYLQY